MAKPSNSCLSRGSSWVGVLQPKTTMRVINSKECVTHEATHLMLSEKKNSGVCFQENSPAVPTVRIAFVYFQATDKARRKE